MQLLVDECYLVRLIWWCNSGLLRLPSQSFTCRSNCVCSPENGKCTVVAYCVGPLYTKFGCSHVMDPCLQSTNNGSWIITKLDSTRTPTRQPAQFHTTVYTLPRALKGISEKNGHPHYSVLKYFFYFFSNLKIIQMVYLDRQAIFIKYRKL